MKYRVVVVSITSVVCLSNCSLGPIVQESAIEYNAAISKFDDEVLLNNILRARDFDPLNYSQLSTVNGSLSAQASVGLSAPFGPLLGSNTRDTVTPSLTLSSTPTFNMAALNTQGFTLGIMQPVSPVYVLSKWNSGLIPHKLLLYLFIKEIQFPNKEGTGVRKYINNPDDSGEMGAFRDLVDALAPTADIKALSLLEPVGASFPFLRLSEVETSTTSTVTADTKTGPPGQTTISSPTCPPATPPCPPATPTCPPATPPCPPSKTDKPVAPKTTSTTETQVVTATQPVTVQWNGLGLATQAADSQFHVGNAERSGATGQLYRIYPNQVVLCVAGNIHGITVYPTNLAKEEGETQAAALGLAAAAKPGGGGGGGGGGTGTATPSATSTSSTQSAASSPSRGSSGSAMPAISAVLQVNRISAILSSEECIPDQLVLQRSTETAFSKASTKFAHIEWRSVSEIFQYLGASLRNPVSWTASRDHEAVTIGGPDEYKGQQTLFSIDASQNNVNGLTVAYKGNVYSVPDELTYSDDHSRQALTILSELVNAAKVSSDIPVTPQIQIIP
jgi:hypothetical protein